MINQLITYISELIYYNIETGGWDIMEQQLSIGRNSHLAFALDSIPNGVCEPSEGTTSQPDTTEATSTTTTTESNSEETSTEDEGGNGGNIARTSWHLLMSVCFIFFASK
jgi:hypothetical protein